jgi:hypothetical protein
MSRSRVRGFRRSDREQLTELVNAHAAAVVPGLSASVSSALAQLERQPGEFIVDPWVSERRTLIAEQNQRVAAAAHLIRYADDDRVAAVLARGCAERAAALDGRDVGSRDADDRVRPPGVYGVPAQWPHIRALYERAGFCHDGHIELVYLARVEDLGRPSAPAGRAPGPQVGRDQRDPLLGCA